MPPKQPSSGRFVTLDLAQPDIATAGARFGAPQGGGGFAAGTLLDTPDGSVAVERLRAGDRLATAAGGVAILRHVAIVATAHGEADGGAVLLPADCLGAGRPRRALWLAARQAVWLPAAAGSGHHPLAAAGLVCGAAAQWVAADPPPLHRLVATSAAVVLADGLPCALRPALRPEHSPQAGAALARARLDQCRRHAPPPPQLAGATSLDAHGRLSGWALDHAASDIPVLLEVLLDDLTIGFALADEARPDLAMAGLGSGACGFALTLALPPAGDPPAAQLLRLHAVGSGAALPGTPLLLERRNGGLVDGRESS